ncbi:unnamed protein product, partial [Amoebophrya sp. A25]|eukprot:GSA25T00025328001.1
MKNLTSTVTVYSLAGESIGEIALAATAENSAHHDENVVGAGTAGQLGDVAVRDVREMAGNFFNVPLTHTLVFYAGKDVTGREFFNLEDSGLAPRPDLGDNDNEKTSEIPDIHVAVDNSERATWLRALRGLEEFLYL